MIITESAISLTSQHSYQEIYHKSESLTVWDNRKSGTNMPPGAQGEAMRNLHRKMVKQASLVELSAQALGSRRVHAPVSPVDEEDKAVADLNMRILAAMVERLTGKKIDITLPEEATAPEGELPLAEIQAEIPEESGQTALQGYGLIYEYSESYRESERTSFSAQGVVHTADGQEIDFSVKLNMSREFIAEKNISIRAGDALKDPLMLNFAGTAADISVRKFTFDIDSDGTSEQISFAGPQSGFLAYDKNGDGRINNGSELFGPETGDGFEELAVYDSDGNNWIDENDDIYENLRIWMKTDSGEDQLFALGEKGVGAIYLNHIASPFSLKDSNNQLLGQVRSSGIFLQEGGGVGTIQQIDLAV
ncbi:MAG: hypothetical protein EHM86_05320 [Desulfobulbaceae bacterium]|nr:MAG: hypothetical protein EHM86_05320 [Desulfobulbaceae bacterium]